MRQLEQRMMVWMQERRSKNGVRFFHGITLLFDFWGWVVFFLTIAILNYLKIFLLPMQEEFFANLKVTVTAWLLALILKMIIRRKRPAQVIQNFEVIGPAPYNTSMPSSHSSSIVSFMVGLMVLGHPLWPVVVFASLLVLFSRYYLGAHFPSDIIGGGLLGGGIALLF